MRFTLFFKFFVNSLSPSSLGYFAVNIFNQNAWKKWSTSLCHLQTIQTMYANGDITTGTMTIPNPNPQTRSTTPTITVPKSMLFGEGTLVFFQSFENIYYIILYSIHFSFFINDRSLKNQHLPKTTPKLLYTNLF